MLKVIDVDLVSDFILELTYSDGYNGEADLAEYFQKEAFSHVTDFQKFSLTSEGSLDWSGVELSAATLREVTVGQYTEASVAPFDVKEMESVIKQASWDSMQEGRADILQAAIRSYNVSRLSPAIRHRLITEQEVVEHITHRHTFSTVEKFVQEVYWRRYWIHTLKHPEKPILLGVQISKSTCTLT